MQIEHSTIQLQAIHELIQDNYFNDGQFTCYFLRQGVNDTYEIHHNNGKKYFLRFNRAHRFLPYNLDSYQFEHNFLFHLQQELNTIAIPVKMISTSTVGQCNLKEGVRYFALYEEARGNVNYPLSNIQMNLLGQELAKVHQKANTFSTPLQRFEIKENLVHQVIQQLDHFKSFLNSSDIQFLKKLAKVFLKNSESKLKDCSTTIVHGDLWWDNIHWESPNELTFIDFDFCVRQIVPTITPIQILTSAGDYFIFRLKVCHQCFQIPFF